MLQLVDATDAVVIISRHDVADAMSTGSPGAEYVQRLETLLCKHRTSEPLAHARVTSMAEVLVTTDCFSEILAMQDAVTELLVLVGRHAPDFNHRWLC